MPKVMARQVQDSAIKARRRAMTRARRITVRNFSNAPQAYAKQFLQSRNEAQPAINALL